jgi:predicted cation transporter
MQRIKVGVIGLVAVVVLIVVASAILGSATRERPIATAGSAQADVVANIAMTNAGAAAVSDGSGEPLAELGVAPSTSNSQSAQ